MLTENGTPVDEKPDIVTDADGVPLKVGEYVQVSDTVFFDGRPFDIGFVEALKPPVDVSWSQAGCLCDGSKTENPGDLVKSNNVAFEAGIRMYDRGWGEGLATSVLERKRLAVISEVLDANEEMLEKFVQLTGVSEF